MKFMLILILKAEAFSAGPAFLTAGDWNINLILNVPNPDDCSLEPQFPAPLWGNVKKLCSKDFFTEALSLWSERWLHMRLTEMKHRWFVILSATSTRTSDCWRWTLVLNNFQVVYSSAVLLDLMSPRQFKPVTVTQDWRSLLAVSYFSTFIEWITDTDTAAVALTRLTWQDSLTI